VASTVSNWAQKTPADFVFAAKVPQTITHDKVLVNCEAEFDEFMERMSLLGAKLGPLVLQFPFFSRSVFRDANAFLARLRVFLKRARETTKARLVVEVRNKDWLNATLTEILREYDASLALVDLSHMPRPWEMEKVDCITSDFVYIRWLGDRKGIEALTPSWDKPVVDRTNDLRAWVSTVKQMVQERKVKHLFLFANNHYSGHAPSTVKLFWEIWKG
jgi:uncharacterized protein YecE (DUF72 family)